MGKYLITTCLFLLIIGTSCSETVTPMSKRQLIINSWHNDYTKNTTDGDFYVPTLIKLPVSRFRQSVSFKVDNGFDILMLSPNDAHYTIQGTYQWENDSLITAKAYDYQIKNLLSGEQIKTVMTIDFKFKVIELTPQKLLMKII